MDSCSRNSVPGRPSSRNSMLLKIDMRIPILKTRTKTGNSGTAFKEAYVSTRRVYHFLGVKSCILKVLSLSESLKET